jgi:outer membrane receptor protein involved in Fe transport
VGFPVATVTPAGSVRPFPGLLTDSEFYSAAGKLGVEISPSVRLQSLTSYQHLRERDVVDAAGLSVINTAVDNRNRIKSFSEELRLIGDHDSLNWSIGGYYSKDTLDSNNRYFLSTAVLAGLRATTLRLRNANPSNPYTPEQLATSFAHTNDTAHQETEVLAGFANADLKLSDLFKITVGGRYTRDKTDFAGCTRDSDGGNLAVINTLYPALGVPTNAQGVTTLQRNECYTLSGGPRPNFIREPLNSSIDRSNFAFRANLDVTPSPTTLFYASISQGYKSGGFPILAASTAAQLSPIRQEKLLAYEVGTKLTLFDRRVNLNVAAFYYNYTDRQVFGRVVDPLFTTLSLIRNVPRSREFGLEGDLAWRITPALSIRLAGTYLNSKVLEFTDFTELGVPADIRGQPFSYTPKFSGSVGFNIDTPVSSELHFIANADASYQTKSQADSAGIPLFRIDSYTLVSGSIGFRTADESVRITLYAQNLFDTYYYTSVASSVDAVFRYPGLPRMLGVRAAFKF